MLLPPRGGAAFRPHFTLTILYFFAFLFLFCAAAATPALYEVWRDVPPGPGQEAVARAVARRALGARVPLAALAALVVTAIGIHAHLLPGFRQRRP